MEFQKDGNPTAEKDTSKTDARISASLRDSGDSNIGPPGMTWKGEQHHHRSTEDRTRPRLRREVSASERMLSPSTATIDCAKRVARLIGELLQCHVVQILHETKAISATIAWYSRDQMKLNKIDKAISRYVVNQECVVSDCSTSDNMAASSMHRLDAQYKSCIAIPIIKSSQKLGMIVASDNIVREWSISELNSVRDLAAVLCNTTAVDYERYMLDVQRRMQRSLVQFTRSNVATTQRVLDKPASHISSVSIQSDLDEDLDSNDIDEETTQIETSRMNVMFDLSARLMRRTLGIDGCILLNVEGLWEYENIKADMRKSTIMGACFLRTLRTAEWHENLEKDNSQSISEGSGDLRSADDEMKTKSVNRNQVFDTTGLTSAWIEDVLHDYSRTSIFNEGKIPETLLNLLPSGTTSAMMTPIYDHGMQPFALILAFDTNHRQFQRYEGHYLEAFSSSIYAEVLNQNLQEANQAKALFISKISHEFRTPLHGILASAEFLNDMLQQDPVPLDFVQTIDTCGRTLLEIINHVLEYSKLKFSNRTLALPQESESVKMEDFDVVEVLEQLLQTAYSSYEFKKIGDQIEEHKSASKHESSDTTESSRVMNLVRNVEVIVASPYRAGGYVVHSDRGAFRRIMLNLIGNALRFTIKGHIIISIEFTAREDGLETMSVRVEDTGIGISASFLDHLFKPFSQESEFSIGTGLGLSIVKELSVKLHGTISVRSTKGKGSSFSIAYPVICKPPERKLFPGDGLQRELSGVKYSFLATETQDESSRAFRDETMKTIEEWFGMRTCKVEDCELLIIDDREDDKQEIVEALKRHAGASLTFSSTVVKYESGIKGSNHTLQSYIAKPCGPYRLGEAIRQCLAQAKSLGRLENQDRQGYQKDSSPSVQLWQDCDQAESESSFAPSTIRPHNANNFTGGDRRTVKEDREEQVLANVLDLKNKGQDQDSPTSLTRKPSTHRPSLTRNKSSKQRVPTALPRTPALKPEESNKSSEDSKRQHILVVEDNPINMMLLVQFARKKGLKVSTATNGLLALSALKTRKSPFAAILMDINMPIMNGFEAMSQIRKYEEESGIGRSNIAAITGLSMDSDRLEARKRGADAFLTKPVKMAALGQILADWGVLDNFTGSEEVAAVSI